MESEENPVHEVHERLSEDFAELRDRVAERAEQLRAMASSFVQDRPLAAVAIAFGAGWLLSGALVSRTSGRLLRLGARLAIGLVLKNVVAGGSLRALASMIPERAHPRTS
jgi:hypothetical protein